MTLANKLTLARLALAVLAFLCLWSQRHPLYVAALALSLAAVATDWVDGYVARRRGQTSPFGALADPVADKVLILGALIAFMRMPEVDVPNWAVFAIIARELVIGGLRGLAGASGIVLGANRAGKWAMGVQSTAVLVIQAMTVYDLYAPWPLPEWSDRAPDPLVSLCALVSVASGLHYIYRARGLIMRSWNAPEKR